VEVLGEDLPVGARAANQAGEVLRDRHESTAVVAQVQHELGRTHVTQGVERIVERLTRRRHEVAEEQVPDLPAVDFVHVQDRHGRNRHRTLGHRRIDGAAIGALVSEPDAVALLRGSERGANRAGGDERDDALAVDRRDAIAALQAGVRRGAVREDLEDAQAEPIVVVGEAKADELAVRIERFLGRTRADVAEMLVERPVANGLEEGFR
jgi:hypothetical protein